MLRNVRLKNFLIKNVFPFFSLVNRFVPKQKNTILIYCSNEALKDNDRAIYDYLIKNRFYHKYKIICGVQNHRSYKKPSSKNVKYIPKQFGILAYFRAAYVFYSFGKIPIKPTKDQMVINLMHGIAFKSFGKLNKTINNGKEFFFTYVCAPSELYRPIYQRMFDCSAKNICICDEPKTDELFIEKVRNVSTKLIVWAPTFRQSAYLGYNNSHLSSFLPLIKDSEWDELNTYAQNKNISLIVKLHAAQDLNGFTEKLFSNLKIYSDRFFRNHGYKLYELLSRSDAFISDYSSLNLEYLLLDRPIAFAIPDLDEYMNMRGFVFENPLDYMPGDKLYRKEDLYQFLDNVAHGRDDYGEERNRVCNLVHRYRDGHNCERVLKIAGISM